ncbi:MAG: hypothetical protein NTY44_07425, partial [Deltaproteobacteria bacterium]|nr:hypothetical protein [Deltaproteobacteria bacterium]
DQRDDRYDGGSDHHKLIDWSSKTAKSGLGHEVKLQPCSSWVMPFVCDVERDNPNSGIKIVLTPAKDEGSKATAGSKR